MSDTADTLNELISVLKDGQTFYGKAAEKVDDPALKTLFTTMQEVRATAVLELTPFVAGAGDEVEDDGTFAGGARRFYADMIASVNDTDRTYIGQLEEHEDRTLKAMDDAIKKVEKAEVSALLKVQREAFQATHDTMRSMKKAA